ncbi:MAG: plastocyanin/azurin family copper-binding protein [Candidatus Limnocylindria bacterium]
MLRFAPRLAPLIGLLLIVSACSAGAAPSASDPGQASPSEMPMTSDDHDESFAWGEPAEASQADRVVEVTMLDSLTFEPASIEVKVGETITFKLINAGKIPHDFTLGDEATQDEHDADMASGMPGMGQEEPNAMTLDPGATGEMTWHFTAPESILFGCHIPGHYAGGMVGSMMITGA